jgi:5'-nucleotidase
MRILVCNDDGIAAGGLALLAAAARRMSGDVWVVAPQRKWTAASHHVSFDRDLALTRTAPQSYACSGTPVDGMIAALTLLLPDAARPDLVLAGVNDKRNVGEDIAYSGTMALAREATFWGVPAVAFSGEGWAGADEAQLRPLHRMLQALWATRREWASPHHWLSINLPARVPAPVRVAQVARDKIAASTEVIERSDDRVVFRLARGRPGSHADDDENAMLRSGAISIVRNRWRCDDAIAPSVLEALRDAASRSGEQP